MSLSLSLCLSVCLSVSLSFFCTYHQNDEHEEHIDEEVERSKEAVSIEELHKVKVSQNDSHQSEGCKDKGLVTWSLDNKILKQLFVIWEKAVL
jgi:hypothetical protein